MKIADEVLPELLTRLQKFHESMYVQWFKECKANGYEVLDLRIGGLESRTRTCMERIRLYLSGELDGLEELDERRLTMDCRSDKEITGTEVMCNNFWIPAFSSCIV